MSKMFSDNASILTGKIYTAGIGIILLPYFLEVLGKEQFGLIGSFVILQACMQILDAGVSGVLTRQSILTQKNHESFVEFINVLKYFLLLFCAIALLVVFFGHVFAVKYSSGWFNSTLEENVISSSVSLMFVIFSLRYIQGPVKSILISYEKHKSLSIFDMIYVSLSSPIALIYLYVVGGNITDFFLIQLIATFFSLMFMGGYAWLETIKIRDGLDPAKSQSDIVHTRIGNLIRFGVQLSLLSMLWVIVNQSDKITLTKYMDLSEYSFYAISISILGLLSIFVSTMIQTVRPRLIAHFSVCEWGSFTSLFKVSVISLISLLLPLIMFLTYYGEDLLYLWTQNAELSVKVMKYLPYLLLGTFFVSMSEFSFMILYSTGNLKAHTIFYSIASAFIIPLNIYVASEYLGEGSAKLFMLINSLLFATWSLYNIRKYLSKTGRMFSLSFLLSSLISAGVIYLSSLLIDSLDFSSLILLVVLGSVTVASSYFLLAKLVRLFDVDFKGSCSL